MEKVIITGSNGLLGQTLVNLLCSLDYKIFALSRGKDRNITTDKYTYYNVDLTKFSEVELIVKEIDPDFIINTAAMTHVDLCEDNKEACDIINVDLVKKLVQFSEEYDIHLIHISTDFIFDGKSGPYKEEDEPNPINYYGLSKWKSENAIYDSTSVSYTILRTILVYGYVKGMNRSNIVLWVKDALNSKKEITIVDDQFRTPTLVDDLAEACLLSMRKKINGVFNVSSDTLYSIYDIAIEVSKVFDLDKKFIKRISTEMLNQRALRPRKTGFDLSKSKKKLNLPIYSFKKRLQYFKSQLHKLS